MKAHISTSNEKTGLPSFNLLAGAMDTPYTGYTPKACEKDGTTGTCNGTCPGCYALRMTRYTACYENYRENTKIALSGDFETIKKTVAAFLWENEPRRFRIHDSGDFPSLSYMEMWDAISKENPETVFYCYTKRIDLLKAFTEKHGRRPAFVVSVSTWAGICEESDLIAAGVEDLPRFEYDDGTRPELANIPHCPAVDKSGKRTGITCAQCKHCSNAKNGEKWAVYAH